MDFTFAGPPTAVKLLLVEHESTADSLFEIMEQESKQKTSDCIPSETQKGISITSSLVIKGSDRLPRYPSLKVVVLDHHPFQKACASYLTLELVKVDHL